MDSREHAPEYNTASARFHRYIFWIPGSMVQSTTQLLHAFIGIYYGFQGAWSGSSMPGSFYNLSLLQLISISPNHGLTLQRGQEIS